MRFRNYGQGAVPTTGSTVISSSTGSTTTSAAPTKASAGSNTPTKASNRTGVSKPSRPSRGRGRLHGYGDFSNPVLAPAIVAAFQASGWAVTDAPVTAAATLATGTTGGWTFTAPGEFIVDILQFPSSAAAAAVPPDRPTSQIIQVGQYLIRATDPNSASLAATVLNNALAANSIPTDASTSGVFGTSMLAGSTILGLDPTTAVVGLGVLGIAAYFIFRKKPVTT